MQEKSRYVDISENWVTVKTVHSREREGETVKENNLPSWRSQFSYEENTLQWNRMENTHSEIERDEVSVKIEWTAETRAPHIIYSIQHKQTRLNKEANENEQQ